MAIPFAGLGLEPGDMGLTRTPNWGQSRPRVRRWGSSTGTQALRVRGRSQSMTVAIALGAFRLFDDGLGGQNAHIGLFQQGCPGRCVCCFALTEFRLLGCCGEGIKPNPIFG